MLAPTTDTNVESGIRDGSSQSTNPDLSRSVQEPDPEQNEAKIITISEICDKPDGLMNASDA